MASVFGRTRPMMARYDVAPAMIKWWKARKPDDGQIVRTLSPYEQQAVAPWLRTFPKRAYDKFMDGGKYAAATFVLVYGTTTWADAADAAEDFKHRF